MTLKVLVFTWRTIGVVVVVGQRLLAQARTTISGLARQDWWPLSQEYCTAQYCGQLVISQMPGNVPNAT